LHEMLVGIPTHNFIGKSPYPLALTSLIYEPWTN
jgi:hypothetical protein